MPDDQKINEYLTAIREQNNDSLMGILGLQKTQSRQLSKLFQTG